MRSAYPGALDSMERVLKISFNSLMHSLERQIVQAGNVVTASGLVSALSRISIVLPLLIVAVDAVAEIDVIRQPESRERRTDLVYEGMVSYGNYRVFGAAENAKLYTGGVELDRELWPDVFHTRVDGVVEFLPFVLFDSTAESRHLGHPLESKPERCAGRRDHPNRLPAAVA
jgi:hypothetical protein